MQQEAPGVWSQDCTQQGTYVVTGLGLTLDIKLLHPERQAPSHCLTTEGVQAVAAWVSHSVELSKPLHAAAAAAGKHTSQTMSNATSLCLLLQTVCVEQQVPPC
jgi:hypothetical protein